MKIRVHRSLLSESMHTMVDIEPTREAIAAFIIKEWPWLEDIIGADDVRVDPYDNQVDHRIEDWGVTYLVLVNGRPFGFCNEQVP